MNKNQSRIKTAARKAFAKGDTEYSTMVPNHGYHNEEKGTFVARRIPKRNYVWKKKTKPFPNADKGMSLSDQRRIFSCVPNAA